VRFIVTVVPQVPGPPLPPADTHGLLLRCRHHYGPIRNPLITALREGLISEIAGPGRHPRVLDDQRDGVEDLYAQPDRIDRPFMTWITRPRPQPSRSSSAHTNSVLSTPLTSARSPTPAGSHAEPTTMLAKQIGLAPSAVPVDVPSQ